MNASCYLCAVVRASVCICSHVITTAGKSWQNLITFKFVSCLLVGHATMLQEGWSALTFAAAHGHANIVSLLLRNGAASELGGQYTGGAPTRSGFLALSQAAKYRHEEVQLVLNEVRLRAKSKFVQVARFLPEVCPVCAGATGAEAGATSERVCFGGNGAALS